MDSNQVKAIFKAAGLRVRVADQGLKFRVCQLGDIAFDRPSVSAIAAAAGLTDVSGLPGCCFNQCHELSAYKPGAIRRI